MKRIFLFATLLFTALCALNTSIMAQRSTTKPRLNHIAVYVHDLAVSTDFYSNVIGLDTIPEPFHDGRHTWYSIGDKSHLHLIQGAAKGLQHEKNSHLCFSVPSVDEFIRILDRNKISYENWAGQKKSVTLRVDGIKQLWFQDPDGYWIEINDDRG